MSAAELPAFSTSRFRAEREADWIAFDLLLTKLEKKGAASSPEAEKLRRTLNKAYQLHEANQMPGFRGCRRGTPGPRPPLCRISGCPRASRPQTAARARSA